MKRYVGLVWEAHHKAQIYWLDLPRLQTPAEHKADAKAPECGVGGVLPHVLLQMIDHRRALGGARTGYVRFLKAGKRFHRDSLFASWHGLRHDVFLFSVEILIVLAND